MRLCTDLRAFTWWRIVHYYWITIRSLHGNNQNEEVNFSIQLWLLKTWNTFSLIRRDRSSMTGRNLVLIVTGIFPGFQYNEPQNLHICQIYGCMENHMSKPCLGISINKTTGRVTILLRLGKSVACCMILHFLDETLWMVCIMTYASCSNKNSGGYIWNAISLLNKMPFAVRI